MIINTSSRKYDKIEDLSTNVSGADNAEQQILVVIHDFRGGTSN